MLTRCVDNASSLAAATALGPGVMWLGYSTAFHGHPISTEWSNVRQATAKVESEQRTSSRMDDLGLTSRTRDQSLELNAGSWGLRGEGPLRGVSLALSSVPKNASATASAEKPASVSADCDPLSLCHSSLSSSSWRNSSSSTALIVSWSRPKTPT